IQGASATAVEIAGDAGTVTEDKAVRAGAAQQVLEAAEGDGRGAAHGAGIRSAETPDGAAVGPAERIVASAAGEGLDAAEAAAHARGRGAGEVDADIGGVGRIVEGAGLAALDA